MHPVLTIILTAVLSSLFTLGLGYYVMRRLLQEHAQKNANKFIDQVKEEIGPVIEERVKQGVKDGVASIPSREVLRETTRTMAKTGVDIVGDTLKPLLNKRGNPRRSRFDDPDDE